MKIDMTHRIKARLDITIGLEPKKPGKYIVMDADYNLFVAEWDGEYFVGDYKSIVGWCPLDRAAEISPADERKLDEMVEIYGDFNVTRSSGGEPV